MKMPVMGENILISDYRFYPDFYKNPYNSIVRRKTTLLKIGKNTKNKHHQRRYMHGKWPSETMLSFTVMENYKPRP